MVSKVLQNAEKSFQEQEYLGLEAGVVCQEQHSHVAVLDQEVSHPLALMHLPTYSCILILGASSFDSSWSYTSCTRAS